MNELERAARIRRLFDEIVDVDPQDRADRLAEACGADEALRRDVESLLAAADERASGVRHALEGFRPAVSAENHPVADPGGIPVGLAEALEDRYVLDREIGRGGMATVYLADDLKHHRKVAVKVLDPELSAVVGTRRFLREIEVAASLRHPHILPLFDSGEAAGLLYYVMPCIEGESLRARLQREKQLPVEDALRFTHEIADALEHAHEKGVIHRDVKPANIMLEADHAVLADFGVAAAAGEAGRERLTRTGMSIGTPAYMSPEQISAERDLDGRSDQYALACVLYEMLAGEPPFRGAGSDAIVRQHLTVEPAPVTEHRPAVPTGVSNVLARALAKSPADRYRGMGEFDSALAEAARAQARTHGDTATSGRVPGRPVGKRLLLTLAMLVVLAGGFIGYIVVSGSGSADLVEGRVVVAVFENDTGDPSMDPLGRIAADRISQGLMQTGLVQVVPSMTAFELAADSATRTDAGWRHIAEATGAEIVVTGEYLLGAGEIRVQTHVVNARTGSLLSSPPPVAGRPGTEMQLIEEVRGRVMSALAARYQPLLTEARGILAAPPTWEAYEAYVDGLEKMAVGHNNQAQSLFVQAAMLDPSFVKAAMMAGIWPAIGERATPLTDSLLQVAEQSRDQLSDGDRALLDWTRAFLDRNPEGAWRALQRAEQANPVFPGLWEYWIGWTDLWLNRPSEAVEHFLRIDPDRPGIGTFPPYWLHRSEAYHRLGEFKNALEAYAMGERRGAPSGARKLDALAAMGETRQITSFMEELGANRTRRLGFRFTRVLAELRVHGHADAVPAIVAGADSLLEAQPDSEKDSLWYRELQAGVLFGSGRLQDARRLFQQLASDQPDDVAFLAYSGVLAARLGDRAEALRISTAIGELKGLDFETSPFAWRAAIAAHLGQLEVAMAYLHQGKAAGEGFFLAAGPHANPLLEPLWDYKPFKEFIRPEG